MGGWRNNRPITEKALSGELVSSVQIWFMCYVELSVEVMLGLKPGTKAGVPI